MNASHASVDATDSLCAELAHSNAMGALQASRWCVDRRRAFGWRNSEMRAEYRYWRRIAAQYANRIIALRTAQQAQGVQHG